MTPRLRLLLRVVRLLLVLAATAAPACGAGPAYGAPRLAPPGTSTSPSPPVSPSPSGSAASALPLGASGSASPSASRPAPSRAGSRAGEGRTRPGRPDGPPAEVMGADSPAAPVPSTSEAAYPEEPETADAQDEVRASVPASAPAPASSPAVTAVRQGAPPAGPPDILPLGSGLMLVGLGLALAFFGLRARRD